MAILPGHNNPKVKNDYEDLEAIAICQWIELLICLAVLFWLISSAWVVLFKHQRYKVLPLATYYSFALPLVLLRTYECLFYFRFILLH